MSKVGRNDPCPCGSGKKYKKCCLGKPLLEAAQNSFERCLDSFWSYEKVNEMSTEEIIDKLQSIGISFEKETFLEDVEMFYSAQQLSENWFKTFKVTADDRDEDFPWLGAWVLWERLAHANRLSMEQMNDLIDKGFEYLDENGAKSACDIWLGVWEAVKFRIKPELKNLDYLDKQYKGSFFVSNFCQDLEQELYNAGFEDPDYYKKCIEYCKEFCGYFPDEDELIIHNMRRSIAESYLQLKRIDEAKNELDSLVRDYPDNPWSYIAYGDMYWFEKDIIMDLNKAKELYERALLVVNNKYDKKVIEERLVDLKN
jgi:tetratricopeptide (TPR) repeat protein